MLYEHRKGILDLPVDLAGTQSNMTLSCQSWIHIIAAVFLTSRMCPLWLKYKIPPLLPFLQTQLIMENKQT